MTTKKAVKEDVIRVRDSTGMVDLTGELTAAAEAGGRLAAIDDRPWPGAALGEPVHHALVVEAEGLKIRAERVNVGVGSALPFGDLPDTLGPHGELASLLRAEREALEQV